MIPFNVSPALPSYYRITHYQPQGGRLNYPENESETIIQMLEDNESTYGTPKKISTIHETDPLQSLISSEPPTPRLVLNDIHTLLGRGQPQEAD